MGKKKTAFVWVLLAVLAADLTYGAITYGAISAINYLIDVKKILGNQSILSILILK